LYFPPEEKRLLPFQASPGDTFAKSVQQFVRPDAGRPSRPCWF
jgi:hypothetical protein